MDRTDSTCRPTTVLLAAASLLALLVPPAHAQAPENERPAAPAPVIDEASEAAATQLRRTLGPGDVVSIVRTTGDAVRGRLLRVGDADLLIRRDADRSAGQEGSDPSVTIPYSDIQALERPRDSSKNGTLIGIGVGVGVWLPLVAHAVAVDRNEMDEWAAGYVAAGAIFAGVGALVGWAIDTAHSKPHVRFEADSRPGRRVRVAPVLARGPGMAVVVSF